jgi:hypothetical protein
VAARCGLKSIKRIRNSKDVRALGGLMRAIIKHENDNFEYPGGSAEGLRRALTRLAWRQATLDVPRCSWQT